MASPIHTPNGTPLSTPNTPRNPPPLHSPFVSPGHQTSWPTTDGNPQSYAPSYPVNYGDEESILEQATGIQCTVSGNNGPSKELTYLNPVRMPDNEPVIILDMGSIGNLGGDNWATELADEAFAAGLKPSYTKRKRPLEVSGVGKGSEQCHIDGQLPVGLMTCEGKHLSGGLNMPIIPHSDLPGLLGLTGMKNNRTIIDTNDNKVYFLGPGNYDLMKAMPPGTEVLQAKIAPTGHMVLPCAKFTKVKDNALHPDLVLHASNVRCADSATPPAAPPMLPAGLGTPMTETTTCPPSYSVE